MKYGVPPTFQKSPKKSSFGGISFGASAKIAVLVSSLDDIDDGEGGGTATKFMEKENAKEKWIEQTHDRSADFEYERIGLWSFSTQDSCG